MKIKNACLCRFALVYVLALVLTKVLSKKHGNYSRRSDLLRFIHHCHVTVLKASRALILGFKVK